MTQKQIAIVSVLILILGQSSGIFIKNDYVFGQVFLTSVLIFQLGALYLFSKTILRGSVFVSFCYGLWVYDIVRVWFLNPQQVDFREYIGFIVGILFLVGYYFIKKFKERVC